ncbi:hypothetical protein TOC8171_28750 [Pseudomonas syringae]
MDIDFEGRVWGTAAQVFGARLQNLVEQGIASFKRQPGLDDPPRVHASTMEYRGLMRCRGLWRRRASQRALGVAKASLSSDRIYELI